MEQGTQVFAAVSLLVIGLSHLLQPAVWVAYYQALVVKGPPGAFIEGFLSLTFGGIIIAFHNVWQGPAVVLTVMGWGQVAKGLARFLVCPEHDHGIGPAGAPGRPPDSRGSHFVRANCPW
jgi:hypothetical protein